jgi:hypothetical protein
MLLQAQLEALLWDVNAPVREATRIRDVLEPMGVTVSLPAQGVRSVRPVILPVAHYCLLLTVFPYVLALFRGRIFVCF